MSLPFFYIGSFDPAIKSILLDEDTSKHIVQVLRMKSGEQMQLTDGKGNLLTAEIVDDHKKHCEVEIKATSNQSERTLRGSPSGPSEQPATGKISIAISLLKNASRFEWFLEKATEIGVSEIIPLLCERTEKEKFRPERMQGIIISAMLQSRQCWLPVLHEPTKFSELVCHSTHQQKFIAHCMDDAKRNLADLVNQSLNSQIILIGPEGDFTKEEIDLAVQHHFDAVTLGDTRLRTETAGIVAASLLRLV
jgi:16S rRNA (uracil1498-N3)-methyltransferase